MNEKKSVYLPALPICQVPFEQALIILILRMEQSILSH